MSLVERLRNLTPPPARHADMVLSSNPVAERAESASTTMTRLARLLAKLGHPGLAERAQNICTRGPLYQRWCNVLASLLSGRATGLPNKKPPHDILLLLHDIAIMFPDSPAARYAEKIGAVKKQKHDLEEAREKAVEVANMMASILTGHARVSLRQATQLVMAVKQLVHEDSSLQRLIAEQLQRHHVPAPVVNQVVNTIGEVVRGAKRPQEAAIELVAMSNRVKKPTTPRTHTTPPRQQEATELTEEAKVMITRLRGLAPTIVK